MVWCKQNDKMQRNLRLLHLAFFIVVKFCLQVLFSVPLPLALRWWLVATDWIFSVAPDADIKKDAILKIPSFTFVQKLEEFSGGIQEKSECNEKKSHLGLHAVVQEHLFRKKWERKKEIKDYKGLMR